MNEPDYPKPDKRLFDVDERTPDAVAHVGGWDTYTQFRVYAHGYQDAADKLVDMAIRSGMVTTRNAYVYPIIFLYRQFVELTIKAIYVEFSQDPEDAVKSTFKTVGHNLVKMWHAVRPLPQGMPSPETLTVIDHYVREFQDGDPRSFTFRYPTTKDLDQVLETDHAIDLAVLRDRIGELGRLLGQIEGRLEAQRDGDAEPPLYAVYPTRP